MNQTDLSTPAPPPARHSLDPRALQLGAGLVVLVAIFYWPALNNGFIWDDSAYVVGNPHLRTVRGLYNIWFEVGSHMQYFPLVFTTFWVEYWLWDISPFGYHATNLLLHAACALLVWRLLVKLVVPGAWLAAAIFAVHPVGVESVAWVSERKNVLSCALALGSLLAYLRFLPFEEPESAPPCARRGPWGYYVLALLLYVGALFSKTATVSVPAVLLVIYWWKRGRVTVREVARLIPFFAVGILFSLVTVWMEKTYVFFGGSGADFDLSFTERTLIAGRALWFYAGKLFWPYPLIFFYPRWTVDSSEWWQYLFPFAALAVVVGLWLARSKIGRGPLAAGLIFGGVLLPELGYFDIYWFRFSFVADHFQYHADIALIALATAAAVLAFERWTQPEASLRVLAAGGALLILGAITYQRTHVYRDIVTLSEDTLVQDPTSWAARYNLGDSLISQGKVAEGLNEMREAVRLSPDHSLRSGLGTALLSVGQLEEAEAQFRKVLLEDELSDRARADAHLRFGELLVVKDQLDEAVDHYRRALQLNAQNHRAWLSYALALSKKGDIERATEYMRKALEINPFDPEVQHGLGAMLAQQGKMAEGINHFETAVEFFPTNGQFREDLGSALVTTGDLESAKQHLTEAIRLNPQGAKAHNLLGTVWAKKGNFNAAIKEFESALRIDPALESAKVNLQKARDVRSRR